MSTASTRRAALGAILAAPLASVPARSAVGYGASPKLIRLIAKHDRINAALDASYDGHVTYDRGLMTAAGALRARILGFPSTGLPDILAKAECMARLNPLEDLEEQLRETAESGHAYTDEVSLGIACELMKFGRGTLCA